MSVMLMNSAYVYAGMSNIDQCAFAFECEFVRLSMDIIKIFQNEIKWERPYCVRGVAIGGVNIYLIMLAKRSIAVKLILSLSRCQNTRAYLLLKVRSSRWKESGTSSPMQYVPK